MRLTSFSKILLLLIFLLPITFRNSYGIELPGLDRFTYPEYNKTISMDFKNVSLTDVLKIFSQQSGLNFIASDQIADKTVNLYLQDVPVDEALERILSANDLTYELSPGSNIFIVKPDEKPDKNLISRVYYLKHASVPSSSLKSTLSDSEDSFSTSEEENDSEDMDSGIVGAVKKLLTESGSVIEDPRTNSLIVTDIPAVFSQVEKTIARLDVRIPQILIEVEMLDISKNSSDLLGAKFGNTPVTFEGAEKSSFFPFNTDNAIDDGATMDSEYSVGTLSFAGLSFTLQFLRTQTDTRNLARPRILTLNNQTAEIKIVTNEAIGVQATTNSSEGTATSTEEAERVDTGVYLRVTPQANIHTREITIALQPKVVQARTGATFGTQTFKDPEERGTKSILRIKDSDTIVIGGLLRTNFSETKTKVPVLSKIPFLGSAFRHTNKEEEQRELLVFITPHILQEKLDDDYALSAKPIIREQNLPYEKMQEVNKALSYMEN